MYSFNTQQQLCEAIRKHLIVTFCYKNEYVTREFAPYAVFVATNNNTIVFGILLKGSSKHLNAPAPRNFDLDKIHNLEITSNTFKPDNNFSINNIDICKRSLCVVDTRQVF